MVGALGCATLGIIKPPGLMPPFSHHSLFAFTNVLADVAQSVYQICTSIRVEMLIARTDPTGLGVVSHGHEACRHPGRRAALILAAEDQHGRTGMKSCIQQATWPGPHCQPDLDGRRYAA